MFCNSTYRSDSSLMLSSILNISHITLCRSLLLDCHMKKLQTVVAGVFPTTYLR